MTISVAAANMGALAGVGAGSVRAPATAIDAAQHKRLTDAAEQFEAMFLQQLLKSPDEEKDADGAGGSEDSGLGSGGDSSYSGFAAEFASKAIAKAGGLGIACSVVAGVERTSSRTAAPAAAVRDMSGEIPGARLKSS